MVPGSTSNQFPFNSQAWTLKDGCDEPRCSDPAKAASQADADACCDFFALDEQVRTDAIVADKAGWNALSDATWAEKLEWVLAARGSAPAEDDDPWTIEGSENDFPDESSDEANSYMDCGEAPLCGLLALETGFGRGNYQHDKPAVHGLWPATGHYGSSVCIKPDSLADPQTVPACYAGEALWFIVHEWKSHGQCSGARSAEDFFAQICGLSQEPLAVMTAAREAGVEELSEFASRLDAAGFYVSSTDNYTSQVKLSACAGEDGRWVLAAPSEYGERCGNGNSIGTGTGGGSSAVTTDGSTEEARTTSAPSAAPMVPPLSMGTSSVKESDEEPPKMSPVRLMFDQLANVRRGDRVCFEQLVAQLAKRECSAITFIQSELTCAIAYVEPTFGQLVENVCNFMGNVYFADVMRNHWFPEPSGFGVGAGSALPFCWFCIG